MNKIVLAAVAMCSLLAQAAHAKPSYSYLQCSSWFKKIDINRDGSLNRREGSLRLLDRVTLASDDSRNGDYLMSWQFFMTECKIGSLGKPEA